MGITFPNALGQEKVLRHAYKRANLDPNQTAYLECHGTGTPTGDPIECRAVSLGMNDSRSTDKPPTPESNTPTAAPASPCGSAGAAGGCGGKVGMGGECWANVGEILGQCWGNRARIRGEWRGCGGRASGAGGPGATSCGSAKQSSPPKQALAGCCRAVVRCPKWGGLISTCVWAVASSARAYSGA